MYRLHHLHLNGSQNDILQPNRYVIAEFDNKRFALNQLQVCEDIISEINGLCYGSHKPNLVYHLGVMQCGILGGSTSYTVTLCNWFTFITGRRVLLLGMMPFPRQVIMYDIHIIPRLMPCPPAAVITISGVVCYTDILRFSL